MKWWLNLPLYTQIAIGGVIGIIVGFLLGENAKYLEPVGTLFINLLKMLIIPLVVTSVLAGILKMKDAKSVGKIGGGFLLYLVLTSFIATSFGVIVALILQPGKGLQSLLDHGETVEAAEFSFVEHFMTWIPTNIFQSLANMDMLPIILFTVFIGLVMITLGENSVPTVTKFVNESANIMLKLTSYVILLAPYGIFALLASLVGTFGSEMLSAVIKFVIADYIALILVLLIVYPIILKVTTGLNPVQFYKNIYPSMLFAFTTSTSTATIPVSMQVSKNNLGISQKTSGFTIPFGATANMDGFAVAIGVISVFAANLYNIPITIGMILQFVLLGLVLSIGAAGVRGAGIVMSIVLLEALGMPLLIIPILAAIWPVIDMGHTTLNIAGDLTGTTVVAKKNADLNEAVFNSTNNPKIDTSSEEVF
ncbi:Proton/sodium-glutamate symport protein [Planococcus massiliensis]|uniref:Proton/sodium-glutamate symport protein n=1 Tax=Planococcus massiliensis TaxID=1499687 RepID=A0A098ENG0_9BACL|nr:MULTISPECIES: dicarboxylate/amino acid:cation symporter [Planococcus]MCJ1909976.1 dicarboxylate/amino acid:cation symporter [Planococcus ruber]CEG23824.1 Proton/sodium-glutamate symport protein [Planococcus massiliensis]